jgi:hypothetical protein
MMKTIEQLTANDVIQIILKAATTDFPDKTIGEIEVIMRNMIGFTVEEAVQSQMAPELIIGEVHLAYLCFYEDHEEEEYVYDNDPKNDMGFWRTGIRVSPL